MTNFNKETFDGLVDIWNGLQKIENKEVLAVAAREQLIELSIISMIDRFMEMNKNDIPLSNKTIYSFLELPTKHTPEIIPYKMETEVINDLISDEATKDLSKLQTEKEFEERLETTETEENRIKILKNLNDEEDKLNERYKTGFLFGRS